MGKKRLQTVNKSASSEEIDIIRTQVMKNKITLEEMYYGSTFKDLAFRKYLKGRKFSRVIGQVSNRENYEIVIPDSSTRRTVK